MPLCVVDFLCDLRDLCGKQLFLTEPYRCYRLFTGIAVPLFSPLRRLSPARASVA